MIRLVTRAVSAAIVLVAVFALAPRAHGQSGRTVDFRSVAIQAYFESGYPHGADQWLSAAASAWATTALASGIGR